MHALAIGAHCASRNARGHGVTVAPVTCRGPSRPLCWQQRRRVAIRQPVKPSRGRLINPLSAPETGAKGERNDAGIQVELVPVRRQCALRRGAVRGLPRQPRLRARQLARLLRRAAERARRRRHRRRATWPMRRSSSRSRSAPRPTPSATRPASADLAVARKQVHVQSLIAAYRFLGSRWADLDPLKRQRAAEDPRARAGVLRPDRGRHGHHVQRDEHLLHDRRAA